MQAVRWTDEATTDLVEIIDYIEQRNPLAAEALHAVILRTVGSHPPPTCSEQAVLPAHVNASCIRTTW